MTIKLHCFGESGNSYKAALALELAGLDWEPVYVDFFNGGARTDEFRALNPMCEVPVMEHNGKILSQSGAIQLHVVEQSGKLGWENREEELEIMRWLFWDNHKLSSQCGMVRFLNNFIPEEKRPYEVIRFFGGRLKSAWRTLDHVLTERDWLVGDRVTIADLSCCGYLYYPEPFGFDRTKWPAINRWLERVANIPGWKHPYDMMPGHPSDRQG